MRVRTHVFNSLYVGRVVPMTAHCRDALVSGMRGVRRIFPARATRELGTGGLRLVRQVSRGANFVTRGVSGLIRGHGITGHVRGIHRHTVTCRSAVTPVVRRVHCRMSGLRLVISSRV